ncbi:MAG: hypothetical protein WAR02_11530 [Pseudolabrys sp.]
MVSCVRNIIAIVGFAGVFGLFAARPFMPPDLKQLVLVFAILLFGATWLLIPIINKLFLGVYLPGPRMTLAQQDALREATRKDQPLAFLSALCFGGAGVLAVVLMKELGWSRNSAIEFGLVVSLFMVVIFSRVRARYGRET